MRGDVPKVAARWRVRLGWLALYWLAGIGTMGVVALGLRWVMRTVGLVSH